MKSRSHRLPAYDPPDDWVNGSWTVDCVCGVNFDDGEEMVDCDECGVWVHTRCSRYVRSEKSFACDKCKSKSSRNNSEETEVAQLLVELPTKTMKMSHSNRSPLNNPTPHRPYRLWTERPMEERVHVQGVPGGDPTLFTGLSSIFTAELWKCSGYVPKKFNFQYKEFPCWDGQKKVDEKVVEDSENMVDKGAGVLYSLSKDSLAITPDSAPEGMKYQVDAGSSAKRLLKGKRLEGPDANNKGVQNIAKKERSLTRPFVIHSGKRKREDTGALKERTGKKKSKEHDVRRNKFILKTVGPASTGRNTEPKNTMYGQVDQILSSGAPSNGYATACNGGKPKNSATPYQKIVESLSSEEAPEHNHVTDNGVKLEKDKDLSSGHVTSHETDDTLPSIAGQEDDVIIPTWKEALSVDNVENNVQSSAVAGALDSMKRKAPVDDVKCAPVEEGGDPKKLGDGVLSKVDPGTRTTGDAGIISSKFILKSTSTDDGVKMDDTEDLADLSHNPSLSSNHISENFKANDAVDSTSHSGDCIFDTDKDKGTTCHHLNGKHDDLPEMPSRLKQELRGSECSMGTEKVSSESTQVTKTVEEASKLDDTVVSPSISGSQHKSVSGGKFVSCSTNVTVSRASSIDKHKSPSSHQPNPVIKRALSNSVIYTKKDKLNTGPSRSEDKHEKLRTASKELPKSSVNPASKASNQTKPPDSSSLKHTSAEAKDFVKHQSSKTSAVEKSSLTSRTGETSSSSKAQVTSDSQNRNTASTVQSKVEKGFQSNSVSASKGNHSSTGHAASSTPPAGLSDEELALLLHQELNSSPRVPRIPRMRQAGTVPHLSSGVATNTYTKRTSSSGNKDQHLYSRRKSKDAQKDGSRSSRGFEGEAKKLDRVPSSPDSSKTADTSNLAESSAEALDSARKNAPQSSATAASNVASSSADHTEQNSPHNNCDDDAGTKGPIHRTLPGLIADIMSKGKRMTYEELCNAVLPHWQNLRKHNGERYAYSSPSQAVLDCLRNRAEWAQLVDRGPKTNANRKRRKLDAEGQNTESEDNGYSEGRVSKRGVGAKNAEPSSREDFPKGKRNARKRRRLALQGRNVKDVRKRRKTKVVSDDESPSFSDSSKESPYSEDDAAAGGEDSASSDETGRAL